MIRLVINGKDADVLQTEKIIGEYAIAPIGDISKRVGARSISFKLPKTANNRSIFESAEQTTSQSVIPYRRIPCSLFVDGVNMNMSLCTLEKVDENYNVRVYGSNANFFDLLKDKKLEDLDLKHLNHHWDVSSLPLFQSANSVLRYPLINWHYDAPNDALLNGVRYGWLGNFLPVVNENYLVEKIINEAGYALDNQVLQTELHQTRTPVIPLGSRTYQRDLDFSRYLAKFELANFQAFGSLTAGTVAIANSVISQNQRYWYGTSVSNYANSLSAPFSYFKISENARLKIRVYLEYKRAAGTQNPIPFRFNLVPNQTPIIGGVQGVFTPAHANLVATNTWQTYDGTFDVDCLNTASAGLLDPDTSGFAIWLQQSTGSFGNNRVECRNSFIEIIDAQPLTQQTQSFYIQYDNVAEILRAFSYVTVANNLPDFTQSDFIKEYMKKFGAIMTVDDVSKNVVIIPFRKIRDNISISVDWSNKVDYTDELQTEFELGYAQKSNFKYADDDTIVKPVNADYTLVVDNQNLEGEKTIIGLKYTASPTNEKSYGVQIANIPLFKVFVMQKETKPKCLLMERENSQFTFRKELYSTTGQFIANPHDRCYFIDTSPIVPNLGFGDNLFQRYYLYLNDILDKVKLLEVKLRLTTNDVSNFDFLKPVYIKELDGYFYVNKIKFEYTAKKSSVVELVKLL